MTRLNIRKLKRGVLKFMVLEALSTKPMDAYEIIKYIYEKFNGLYKPSPGSIYPILKNMIKRNMIEVREVDGKKIYEITQLGREELDKMREQYRDVYP
ncbi:MAG: PadR family transcriptional regulator, partial [Sulfolobaceae archaeon]